MLCSLSSKSPTTNQRHKKQSWHPRGRQWRRVGGFPDGHGLWEQEWVAGGRYCWKPGRCWFQVGQGDDGGMNHRGLTYAKDSKTAPSYCCCGYGCCCSHHHVVCLPRPCSYSSSMVSAHPTPAARANAVGLLLLPGYELHGARRQFWHLS